MGFHQHAIVESDQVGRGSMVWAFAHVMPGAKIGANCNIGDHAFVEGGAVIGDNVTLKNQVCVWRGVTIEDDAFIGPRVTFTNDRHPRSPRMPGGSRRYADADGWLATTRVGRGASIGAAATICPGIELGPYCMVAAGAVVTKSVPAFALVAGVPARRRADVCRCGQPLAGAFDAADCGVCGETAEQRRALAAATTQETTAAR